MQCHAYYYTSDEESRYDAKRYCVRESGHYGQHMDYAEQANRKVMEHSRWHEPEREISQWTLILLDGALYTTMVMPWGPSPDLYFPMFRWDPKEMFSSPAPEPGAGRKDAHFKMIAADSGRCVLVYKRVDE